MLHGSCLTLVLMQRSMHCKSRGILATKGDISTMLLNTQVGFVSNSWDTCVGESKIQDGSVGYFIALKIPASC